MIAIQCIFDSIEIIINDRPGVFRANIPLRLTGWLQHDVMLCFSTAARDCNETTQELGKWIAELYLSGQRMHICMWVF